MSAHKDTPETDKEQKRGNLWEAVSINFARRLERSRDRWKSRALKAEKERDQARAERDEQLDHRVLESFRLYMPFKPTEEVFEQFTKGGKKFIRIKPGKP